jgi:hypothetical protein
MKVLVLTTYPSGDASRRVRIDPLVAELRSRGRFQVRIHCLLNDWMYKHKNGCRAYRALIGVALVASLLLRLCRCAAVDEKTVVLVHREAFPFFTPAVERFISRRARAMVIDVDDGLHAEPTHVRDWRRRLRNPAGFDGVLQAADLVLAGNRGLAERASSLGTESLLKHTAPVTSLGATRRSQAREPLLLWTGSYSTLGSLELVLPETLRFCERAGVRLLVLGGTNVGRLPSHPLLTSKRWSADAERQALSESLLGLMPLPQNAWEQGKSGYKLLLYLFHGVPVVASAVGINADFAGDPGVTLVSDLNDWSAGLARGLESARQTDPQTISSSITTRINAEGELKSAADLLESLGH